MKLPQYIDQEVSKFSTVWLDGFEARHNIKKYNTDNILSPDQLIGW